MVTVGNYIATSERAFAHSDEVENIFTLYNTELEVGDSFEFDGINWYIDEVLEIVKRE